MTVRKMTQKNNSLVPDGYRFWSDDNVNTQAYGGINDAPEPETQHLSALENQPLSVEDLEAENAHESEASEKQASAQEQSEALHATSDAGLNSALADLWLKSLRLPQDNNQVSDDLSQEPSAYWRCDNTGAVVWFIDQNGIGWSKNLAHEDLFFSEDGGERAANIHLTGDGCSVEDVDGSILNITFAGMYSIQNRRTSREKKVRSLLEIFCSVDTNGDECLSLEEIENALHSCNETDRPLINSIKTHFKRIAWTRRGMFGQAAEGLSLRDILDLTSNGVRTSNEDIDETLLAQIEAVIDFVDPKRVGFIEHDGLEDALSHLVMPPRLRRSIELLIRRLSELRLLGSYGFSVDEWRPSRQDVRWMLCDLFKQLSGQVADDMPAWASLELCSSIEQDLYASKTDPTSSITIDAIQHCPETHQSFMAVVAAVIVHWPELVLQTIRRSDNGAFVVTFIGDRNTPIRVLLPAQKELHDYGLTDKHGVWALILAKGFAQYLQHKPPQSIHDVAQLFVGNEVKYLSLKEQCSNDLAMLIDRLWAQDSMLVLSRFPDDVQNTSTSVLKHTCAVTGWEPQSGTLSVFCPQSDVEQISIDELRTSFDVLLST